MKWFRSYLSWWTIRLSSPSRAYLRPSQHRNFVWRQLYLRHGARVYPVSGSLACDTFVNKDLTNASYVLFRPLMEAVPSRGIIISGNVGYGVKSEILRPLLGRVDVQQLFS